MNPLDWTECSKISYIVKREPEKRFLHCEAWHSQLLDSMARRSSNRPAVISESLCDRLDIYMHFRFTVKQDETIGVGNRKYNESFANRVGGIFKRKQNHRKDNMMKKILFLVFILAFTACAPKLSIKGTYRQRITIDHMKVLNVDQSDFPVLISLADPALKSKSYGGHVSQSGGEDIFFTLLDGKTILPREINVYNPAKGELKAWVRIPLLSASHDTEIYLHYGNPGIDLKPKENVWDSHYKMVKHLNNAMNPHIQVHHSEGLNITDEITVQAWVYSDNYQAEAFQPIVSKWASLTSFDTFDAYDASKTDGLRTIGFFGAVFDGRYVYFSPQRYGHEKDSTHGYALRYDTQGDFKDKQSWSACDAGNTDGLNTKGHYGAVFDGRYVYFVPRGKNYGGKTGSFNEFQSNLLRYDTHMDFKSSESWAAYDMGVDISKQSAAFDGRYIYFCPGYEHVSKDRTGGSSKIFRFDTESGFKDPSSYRILDVSTVSDSQTGNYDGAAFDGRYVYFVPLTSGVVLQYNTKGDYEDRKSWRTYDAKPLGMKMNVGAMFDGRYLYFSAYGNGVIVKYDTYGDFTGDDSWQSYDASNTKGLDTAGFDGGFFDGRYIYFAPFVSPRKTGGYSFHTNYLRYDTQGQFDDPGSWDAYDASNIDNLATIGYNGGASDGRFLYLAPWQDRTDGKFGIHGNVLRYDTVGENGSFSLRYCDYGHNGGLCAAVPGPSFIINTVKGPLSIAAHEVLVPGWHHVAGVYNGDTIKLFIDGILVAERSGSGLIQTNNVSVVIGRLHENAASFRGIIDEVRISDTARNDDRIKTEYLNLVNPAGFIRVGKEEVVR